MAIRSPQLCTKAAVPTLLLIGLVAPTTAGSQETIIPLQLSFSDPGARSLGFGGAFVALADDATAAFANPAGLVQLVRPEISAEWRHWSHSTPFTESGRVEGLPSGFGIDTAVGLRTATSRYDASGLSFLSLAYPRGDWSVAFFRHQYADLEFTSETQGLFGGTTCCPVRQFDQRATSDLNVVSYGLAAAYRVGDRFSVGVTLVYFDASLHAWATEYKFDDDSIESFFARNSYLPSRSNLSTRLFLDDTSWTVTGGFLWKLSERWSLGGVYRQGAELNVGVEATAGEANDLGVAPGTVLLHQTGVPVDFPDDYGLGVAYRASGGRLTLSAQWNRVEYSDIHDSLNLDDAVIDDANHLHLGAEYVFLDSTPIVALRLGAWRDPDHQMRSTSGDPFNRALRPSGKDEMHFALGIGVALRRYQIDLAVDYSDQVKTASLSAITNF